MPRQALACTASRTAQLASAYFCNAAVLLKLSTLAVFNSMATPAQPFSDASDALSDLLASMQVPPDLCRALESTGIESVPDFAFAYNSTADLDVFLSDKYDELWLGLGITDPAHSPAMARLRRALKRAQNLTEMADSPATASSSIPTAPASLNAWAEHAPPRLDASSIAQLVKDFHTNYPGDAMPRVRLLSIVHRWFSPGNSIS